MVSESVIAEARRKALRNGEEDPVAVAQRYLNVYRQMHIFSQERKDEFDQSLLNLQPITISIISSLPGGLTFQDYIDEVLLKFGRAKSAREGNYEAPLSPQHQILSNAQASAQPQQIIAPVMGGEAKLSMGKEFADEFAKIMSSIVAKQTIVQKDSLAKVAQDLGKTQLFIAKKLEDNRTERQTEISALCKTIAQSHTALSTSLATLGKNIANQIQENNVVSIPQMERKPEDDARLAAMITQSQERIMSAFLSRLPQAVGVGNVNVNTPSRSIEDDARLAEMIAQSQEKVLTRLIEKLPQSSEGNSSLRSSENIEEIMAIMAQSQEKLISALAEKLPQASAEKNSPAELSKERTLEDDERLVDLITKSQEKLISTLIEKMPQLNDNQKADTVKSCRSEEDDERLVRLIANTQENMIKSLIEKNILVTQNYAPYPAYNTYQNSPADNSQYYYNPEPLGNSYSNINTADKHQNYISNQITDNYSQDNINFDMFTPIDEANDVSSIIYDPIDTNATDNKSNNNDVSLNEYLNTELTSETKKKKKKKKKKKNNNTEVVNTSIVSENVDDGLGFLDDVEEDTSCINFDDVSTDFASDNYTPDNEYNDSYINDNQITDAIENSWEGYGNVADEEVIDFESLSQEQNFYDEPQSTDTYNDFQQFDDDIDIQSIETVGDYNNIETDEYVNETYNSDESVVTENFIDDTENSISFDDVASFEAEELSEDDEDFDEDWLNFKDINTFPLDSGENDIKEDTSKTNWDTIADSWGFSSNEVSSDNKSYSKEGDWEYVEDDGSSSEDGWEYVEDDASSSDDYEWEYVEDDGSSSEDGWEYVEAIDDNAKIYSSDSYSQQTVPAASMFNSKKEIIQLTNAPQIHYEATDDEIDYPYKNSIIKD